MNRVPDRFTEASDALLTLAIARYDEAALAEAYSRHGGAVFSLARRLLSERAVAEEIVQEIFLRLWHDPTRFDAQRGTLRSYLLTQTHCRAVDVLRADTSRRAREQREARRTVESGLDVEREVWELTVSQEVRRSMESLPAAEREAIELAYFGGYTYREVAVQLEEPEGTVKSWIRNGLKRLRRELAAAGVVTEGV